MSLSDCIRNDVVTASPEDSVEDIAQLMDRRNVGSVIITRNERPVGIVTDRDLVIRVTARDKDPKFTSISDIMTRDPLVIREEDSISDVMSCVREMKVRRLPVVDENECLVGIVSLDDVVSELVEEMNAVIRSSAPAAR
jgi:CBS domain-containing protein